MKKILALLLPLLLLASCATPPQLESAPPEKRVKVGFYIDDGSMGSNIFTWSQLLYYSPQMEVTLLTGEDLRAGKLAGLDLLLIPGGSSARQYRSMQEEGAEAVRSFVAAGGAYFGVCAGFHCVLNRDNRLRLLPFGYVEEEVGNAARVTIDLSEKGAELLGVRPGERSVQYSYGPIACPAEAPGDSEGEVLATYKSTVGPYGRNGGNFYDTPAIIYGRYGKGKVIATGFHPETWPSSYDLGLGCIYAVTGVRPTPVFPIKNPRPHRVGFIVPSVIGEPPIRQMLELNREPDIDLVFFGPGSIVNEGDHLDALVFPAVLPGGFDKISDYAKESAEHFMDRGGLIYAKDPAFGQLPPHQNLIHVEADGSFAKAILNGR